MKLEIPESVIEARKAVGVLPEETQSWAYAFAAIVGARRVLTGKEECAAFRVGCLTPRAVIYPRSAEDAAAILGLASSWGLVVIPVRNGTKLDWANPPSRYDIALSLKDLNQVWHYEPDDLTLTVEAGMKFGDLQRFLSRRNLWLPLDPPGGLRSSVGGILAVNASGPLRLRYGAARDMVIGMKFATAAGKVVKTGGRVVKNVAGYDLSKLMIGSFGTLAVILEASFKLFPLPPRRQTFVFAASGLEVFRELRRSILASPLAPMRMVLLNAAARSIAAGESPGDAPDSVHELWVEAGGPAPVLRRSAEILSRFGGQAGLKPAELDDKFAREAWNRIADYTAWRPSFRADCPILKATLPIASSEKFLESAYEEAERHNPRLACFAQTGTGVLLLCILEPGGHAGLAPFVSRLRELAASLGGGLAMLSTPLALKQALDSWGEPPTHLDSMRKLKQALDPNNILSPGRFVHGI
jgi:glycolate oxidase FAD binding subunit